MGLLAGLGALQRELAISIEVAHVDHGFRVDSALDAEFVRQECSKRGTPFHTTKLPPRPKGVNLEAWARDSRYRYLKTVRDQIGADWIVTAHHANDAAETLLMQLLSNKEPNGIKGADEELRVLRPLLGVRRRDLERFAARFKVSFRHDSSNDDETFLRNRVRKTLLPLLETRFDPSIVASLADRAVLLAEDEGYLSSLARLEVDPLQAGATWGSPEWVVGLRSRLDSLPRPLRWRFVEELLRPELGFSLGARKADEVARFVESGRGEVILGGRLALRWVAGEMTKSLLTENE
jgi:tRNA(Ile)-lysidine synthase